MTTDVRAAIRRFVRTPEAWALAVLAFFLVVVAAARIAVIVGRLPYGQHWDEGLLMQPAVNILKTRDLNPHFFNYPSLPIYLIAASMRFSSLFVQQAPPVAEWIVPSPGGYYTPAFIYTIPRVLFALGSMAIVACTGALAWVLVRSPVALLFAPMVLVGSGVFRHSSLEYLNVDGLTALFATCTILATLSAWERDDILYESALPGALAGLTIACKYNSGLVLLTPALAIAFTSKSRRLAKLSVLGLCAAAVFLICVPYAVLDATGFLRDLRFEFHHYRSGHKKYDGDAGWPQLEFYLRSLSWDLGPVTTLLMLLGLGHGARRDWRRTLAVASFPLALVLYMSTNRVHFLRTVLPVFTLAPVFAAGGLVWIAGSLRRRLAQSVRAPWVSRARALPHAVLLAELVLAVPCLAWTARGALGARPIPPDTRNVAVAWLATNAPRADLYFAPETHFAPSTAKPGMRVHVSAWGLSNLDTLLATAPSPTCYVAVPTYGGDGASAANARVWKVLGARQGKSVFSAEGREVVPWTRTFRGSTENAALSLYRVACGEDRARRPPARPGGKR